MLKRGDKKAQGLSINAIILIVLGIVVLAVLIIGFTIGWGKIAPWISTGGNNIDTIVQQCSLACTTSSMNDYCNVLREVKGVEELKGQKISCKDLVNKNIGVVDCDSFLCESSSTEKVYNSLSDAKAKCPAENQQVFYLVENQKTPYKCLKGDLATSAENAKYRCIQVGQKIEWLDQNVKKLYSCGTGDISN